MVWALQKQKILTKGDRTMWKTDTKYLNDHDNQDGVVTRLDTDILEPEIKWVERSITTSRASGCDGIPAELFKS